MLASRHSIVYGKMNTYSQGVHIRFSLPLYLSLDRSSSSSSSYSLHFLVFFVSFSFILCVRFVNKMESMPDDIFTQNFHCKRFQFDCVNSIFHFIFREISVLFLFDSNMLSQSILIAWKYVRMVRLNRRTYTCTHIRLHHTSAAVLS